MNRTAAICLDATEWWYLERLLDEGKLPNLARLRARSAVARIHTEIPYRSEVSWARFLSGREPLEDKDWAVCVTFDPDRYDIGINPASTAPPFYAFGEGTKVIALDLVQSCTADDVDGVQVIGWGTHSPMWPRSSRPVGLLREIDQRFGVAPAFDNDFDCGWHDPAFLQAVLDANRIGATRRVDIATWLLEEHPDWDLFLTSMSEFHSLGHHAWHGVDATHPLHGVATTTELAGQLLEDVTVAVDIELGRLLDALGEDTNVLVFAMHGFQPADDLVSTVLLPELAHRLHLGSKRLRDPDQAAWRRAGCPPLQPDADVHIGSLVADAYASTTKTRVRRALPPAVRDLLRRARGGRRRAPLSALAKPVPPECEVIDDAAIRAASPVPTYQPVAWYRDAWPTMPWFALPSFADGHIRVNLRGRERGGMIDKEDYGATLDQIEQVLRECRDARTGASIVEQVLRLREADPFDPDGPAADLLVIWKGAPDAIEHPTVGTIGPFPHFRSSHHTPDGGWAMVGGPGIAADDLGVRPAIDLTPTVLALMGRAPGPRLRGRSLVGD